MFKPIAVLFGSASFLLVPYKTYNGPVVKSGITSRLHREVRGSNPHVSTISNGCIKTKFMDKTEYDLEIVPVVVRAHHASTNFNCPIV